MYKGKLAIVVNSFNRPHCLKQVLNCLKKNNLEHSDVYVFQGGRVNLFSGLQYLSEETRQKCLNVINNSNIDITTYTFKKNYGIGIGQYLIKRKIFGELHYDAMLFFEDDIIFTRYYVRLIRVLLDQFKSDGHIGTVQALGLNPEHRILTYQEKKNNLRKLTTGDFHWWGWATWRHKWKKMEPFFKEYYGLINDVDYQLLNRWKIKKFYLEEDFRWSGVGSQDKAMAYARYKAGMYGINTVVNRAKNIGKFGTHYTEKSWEEQNREKHKLHTFEKDGEITSFREPTSADKFFMLCCQLDLFKRVYELNWIKRFKLDFMADIQEGIRMIARKLFGINGKKLNNLLYKFVRLWSKPPR